MAGDVEFKPRFPEIMDAKTPDDIQEFVDKFMREGVLEHLDDHNGSDRQERLDGITNIVQQVQASLYTVKHLLESLSSEHDIQMINSMYALDRLVQYINSDIENDVWT